MSAAAVAAAVGISAARLLAVGVIPLVLSVTRDPTARPAAVGTSPQRPAGGVSCSAIRPGVGITAARLLAVGVIPLVLL